MQRFLSNQKLHLFILFVCWVLLQVFLLWQFGIFTGLEAEKYIGQANHLLQTGMFESNNFLFYSTQILLIAGAIKLQTGFWVVVLLQMLANVVSLFLFYKLVYGFTRQAVMALIATFLLLCMFYYQLYNVHLYTESLFFSLSILYTFTLFRLQKRKPFLITTGFLLLSLLLFTRPTGVLFIPPTVLFLILRFGKKRTPVLLLLFFIASLLLFYFLLNAILNSGGELNFLLPYIEEHVICGVPTVQQSHNISMPVNANSVEGLWHIINNNSELFLKLAGKRFLAFWGVQRIYYSSAHNAFVAIYFYSLYVLILFGLKRTVTVYRAESVFLLTYIFLVMLTVMLSCDEWHNRFLYSLLPFLLLLAFGAFAQKRKQ